MRDAEILNLSEKLGITYDEAERMIEHAKIGKGDDDE